LNKVYEAETLGIEGYYGTAALAAAGEMVGATQIYEGIKGKDFVTGRSLSGEERGERLGEGTGSVALLAAAKPSWRGGMAFGRQYSSYGRMNSTIEWMAQQPLRPRRPWNSNDKGTIAESVVADFYGYDGPTFGSEARQYSFTSALNPRSFRRLDGIIPKDRIMVQVKNVKNLSKRDLGQIYDTIIHARQQGYTVDLWVRPGTPLVRSGRSPWHRRVYSEIQRALDDGTLSRLDYNWGG
jgi:hypothetical protein